MRIKLSELKKIIREELNNKWSQESRAARAIEQIKNKHGDKPSINEVADFIFDNWVKITGLKKSDKCEESYFPTSVEIILEHFNIDLDYFSQVWLGLCGG